MSNDQTTNDHLALMRQTIQLKEQFTRFIRNAEEIGDETGSIHANLLVDELVRVRDRRLADLLLKRVATDDDDDGYPRDDD